uniref:Uncharacterized protein n=1 Tax=Acrobeloides nanus TaxID=290746 RepID=A0A914DZA9_9BILA
MKIYNLYNRNRILYFGLTIFSIRNVHGEMVDSRTFRNNSKFSLQNIVGEVPARSEKIWLDAMNPDSSEHNELEEERRERERQKEERREKERRERERLEAIERERLRQIEEQREHQRERERLELERRAEQICEMERREAEKRERDRTISRMEKERRLGVWHHLSWKSPPKVELSRMDTSNDVRLNVKNFLLQIRYLLKKPMRRKMFAKKERCHVA